MSIRRVTCPGCRAEANVPVAMTNARCAACGTVWNVMQGVAAMSPPPSKQAEDEIAAAAETPAPATAALLVGLVGGVMFLMATIGLIVFVVTRPPDPALVSAAEPEQTIKPAIPEPYREIRLPEEARRRIYRDYRTVARTTVEAPLILPQGTKARQNLEVMLEKTYDRELLHFAALHDITVDEVKEVIKEGDAKVWDDSPRSNAVRDGKRVYTKEMSEGWKRNPNRK